MFYATRLGEGGREKKDIGFNLRFITNALCGGCRRLGERTPPAGIFYCSIFHHHFAVNSEFIRPIHLADSSEDWLETRALLGVLAARTLLFLKIHLLSFAARVNLRCGWVMCYLQALDAARARREANDLQGEKWLRSAAAAAGTFSISRNSLSPFAINWGESSQTTTALFYYSNVQERGEYLLLKMWLLREREREKSADRATFQRPPSVLKSLGMSLRWKSHFFCFFGNNQFALYAALTRWSPFDWWKYNLITYC
jgi:hypothetical protein